MLSLGTDINLRDTIKQETALFRAVRESSWAVLIVTFLIDKGCNIEMPNIEGNTVLFDAVNLGKDWVLSHLLSLNVNAKH